MDNNATSKLKLADMSKIFILKTGLTDYIEGNWDFLAKVNVNNLFNSCINLTSFNGDLSSLTDGNYMFNNCKNLTSFNGDLSSLTNGSYMFFQCSNLTSFNSDLSSLTNGNYMFNNATKLASFNGDLSSLTNGNYMFGGTTSSCTRLDLTSIKNMATTINDLAAKGTTGSIRIGINKTLQDNEELNTALATIRSKGWTVTEIYSKN